MTKKGFLTKILPAALIMILVLAIVLVISSCSKPKSTPYGSLSKTEYASITINGKKKTISQKEVYDRLRYQGTTTLVEEIEKIAFASEYSAIKTDIDQNGSSSKYYDRLVEMINLAVYQTDEQDEIDEMKSKEKAQLEKTFYNNLKLAGVDVVEAEGIFQATILEQYYLDLAKEQYAKDILLEEVEDVESDYYISNDNIGSSYNSELKNKGDISAIVVKFSTSAEVTAVLKELRIKFVKDKLYRVEPLASQSGLDYEDVYKNFSTNAEGVTPLNKAEVLFEYVRLYNYMYSYRDQINLKDKDGNLIDFDLFLKDKASLTEAEKTKINDIYAYIYSIGNDLLDDSEKQTTYAQFKEEITSQTAKVNYTYEDLENDTTIRSYLYNTLYDNKKDVTPYTYSSTSAANGYFLAFKLKDCLSLSFEAIDTLAKYVTAVSENQSADAIYTLYQDLKEYFYDQIKVYKNADGTYKDEEVKAFFLETANALNVENVYDEAWDKENEDSMWTKVFDSIFTSSYITEKVNEKMEDVKVVIYDPLLEILYSSQNSDYKTTKETSKNYVASVKVDGKNTKISVDDFFAIMEKKSGASVVQNFLTKEALKAKYQNQITDDEMEEYEESFEVIMSNFAADGYAAYGLSASIGKSAFMQLYFGATNRKDAIFNMYIMNRLDELYTKDNIEDAYENIYNKFESLAAYNYDQFISLTFQTLTIYVDDDEDGVADKFEDMDAARAAEVKNAAVKLINRIYDEFQYFSSSAKSTALSTIASEYTNATRVSKLTTLPPDYRFTSSAEKASFLWAEFKQLGIFVSAGSSQTVVDPSTVDEILADQLVKFYNDYAKSLIDEDKYNPEFIAKTITGAGDLDTKEVAEVDKLIITEDGIKALYVTEGELPESAEFTEADNPDDDEHHKLYPYDKTEDSPYTDPEEFDIDNTLYNDHDKATANQIEVYVREADEGNTSLTSTVASALGTFFKTPVYDNYLSDAMGYILRDKLLAEFEISTSAEIEAKIEEIIKIQQYNLFTNTNDEYAQKWWETFSYTRYNGTVINNTLI